MAQLGSLSLLIVKFYPTDIISPLVDIYSAWAVAIWRFEKLQLQRRKIHRRAQQNNPTIPSPEALNTCHPNETWLFHAKHVTNSSRSTDGLLKCIRTIPTNTGWSDEGTPMFTIHWFMVHGGSLNGEKCMGNLWAKIGLNQHFPWKRCKLYLGKFTLW